MRGRLVAAAVVGVVAVACAEPPDPPAIVDTAPWRLTFVRPADPAQDPFQDPLRDSVHIVIDGAGDDDVALDIAFGTAETPVEDVPLGLVHIEVSVFDFAERLLGFGAADVEAAAGDTIEVPLLPPLLYVVDNFGGPDGQAGRAGLHVVDLRGREPSQQRQGYDDAPTVAQHTDVVDPFGAFVVNDGKSLVIGAERDDHAVVQVFDTFDIAAAPRVINLQTRAGVMVPLGDGSRALVGPADGPVAWLVDVVAGTFDEVLLPVGVGTADCGAGDRDGSSGAFLGCAFDDGPHLLHLQALGGSGDPTVTEVALLDDEVRDLRVIAGEVFVARNSFDGADSDAFIDVYDSGEHRLLRSFPVADPGRGRIRRLLRSADASQLFVTLEPIFGSDNGCCSGFAVVDPADGAVAFLTDDGGLGMSSATTAPGGLTFAGMTEYGNTADGDIMEVRGGDRDAFGIPMTIGNFYVDNVLAIAAPFGERL